MLTHDSEYRDFLNARLRDALLRISPLVALLCLIFAAFSLLGRPGEIRWTAAVISLFSALLLAGYSLLLRFRSSRWLVETGSFVAALWLIVGAAASTMLSLEPGDLVYLGVIPLAAGAIFVHRNQMAALTAASALGAVLAWSAGPRDAVWFEMIMASLVAACTGWLAFRARLEAFRVAFDQGRQKLEAGLRYQRAADGADSALWEYEPDTGVLTLAPRWAELFGYSPAQLENRLEEWTSRIHNDDRKSVIKALGRQLEPEPPRLSIEHRIRCGDGSYRWALATGRASLDASGRLRVAGSFSDIDERKALERRLMHEALHDRLTDLANRRLLLDRLDQMAALAERHPERRFGVAFFDLDGFKRINDMWGHAVGDRVLVEMAARLKRRHRSEDLVARLGGDELVVVLDEAATRQDAEAAAERSRAALEEPIDLDGRTAWVSVSWGVAWSGDHYPTGAALLDADDMAMYQAKRRKRSAGSDYDEAAAADSSAAISAADARARSRSPGG